LPSVKLSNNIVQLCDCLLPQNGPFDPVARNVRVTSNDLVLNIGLRAAVAAYLEEHPWAWDECRWRQCAKIACKIKCGWYFEYLLFRMRVEEGKTWIWCAWQAVYQEKV